MKRLGLQVGAISLKAISREFHTLLSMTLPVMLGFLFLRQHCQNQKPVVLPIRRGKRVAVPC